MFSKLTVTLSSSDAPIVQVSASKTTVTEGQDSLQLTCEVRMGEMGNGIVDLLLIGHFKG